MVLLLTLTVLWLALVAVRFRTSRVVLLGGLILLAVAALGLAVRGDVAPKDVGLAVPESWVFTLGLGAAWTIVMLLLSPAADRLAARLFAEPPKLDVFRVIQESRLKLLAGIAFAWIAGGFLEELALRGIVLRGTEGLLAAHAPGLVAVAVAVLAAAVGAFVIHLYQGLRAAFIVAQLSVLFGVVFVLGGECLWTVILAHGLYDTVAFIRFASGSSKYAKPDPPAADVGG